MTINGSCFCGEISYKIKGTLGDGESCHCSMCRKMFASQASSYALLNPEEFSWSQGERKLTNFVSQKDYKVHFCSVCGSTLAGSFKDQICWVSLGCVEGDPKISIAKHIFVGSKANWEVIPHGALQYEAWSEDKT